MVLYIAVSLVHFLVVLACSIKLLGGFSFSRMLSKLMAYTLIRGCVRRTEHLINVPDFTNHIAGLVRINAHREFNPNK